MKIGSLFDGSGGFPLAGYQNGFTPVWASEVEPYPIRVTKERFPGMKHLGSVTEVNGAEIEPVDVITFGSPCQDLSVAGKQKGIHDGARSSLFFQAVRIIKEMRENDRANGRANEHIRPRFAVWENVPGAYSSNGGRDFQAVLQALCEIADPAVSIPFPQKGKWANAGCIVGDGYSIAWRTYDAQYWPRTPQRRKRIYLIEDFASERAGEILFERESMPRHIEPGEKTGEGIAADAERSAGGSDQTGGMNGAFMGGQGAKARSIAYCDDGTTPTLKASNSGSNQAPDVVYSIEENIVDRSSAKNGKGWSENQSPTLNTIDRHAVCYPDVSRTLTARFDSSPCIDRGGEVVCYGMEGDGNVHAHIGDNVSPCMKTIHPNCVCYNTTQITYPANYSNPKIGDPCHPLASNQHPPLLVVDCRGNGGGITVPTLTGDHENRVTDYTAVVVMATGQANAEIIRGGAHA